MSDNGIQSQLYEDGTKDIQEDLFITMPRQFGKTKYLQLALYRDMCYTYSKELVNRILDEQDCSIDDIGNYITKTDDNYFYCDTNNMGLETLNNYLSINNQITNLKSQLKHCKNPLQKLNLEREMNRLMREKKGK